MDRLPADVLLYILNFCRLRDSLCLTLVSKALHDLITQRAFWIIALRNERRFKPIACTLNEDLTKYEMDDLRKIALWTLRLERNWTSERPKILGSVKTVMLGLPRLDTLFQIPGTLLYVFHCPATGNVELWDADLGRKVGEPIEVGKNVWDVSPGEDLPGKFSMGLLAAPNNGFVYKLLVVCVEYGGPEEPTLTSTLAVDLMSSAEHWAVFIDPEFVGTLCYSYVKEKLCVTAVNRTSRRQTIITTDLPSDESPLAVFHMAQSGTAVVNGDLSLIFAATFSSLVFTLPRRYLPTNANTRCPSEAVLAWGSNFVRFGSSVEDEEDEVEATQLNVLTANDTYGVVAISLGKRDIWTENDEGVDSTHRELGFTAWVIDPPSSSGTPNAFPIHVAPLQLEEPIPGTLQNITDPESDNPWLLVVQTLSGRKTLILTDITPEGTPEGDDKKLLLRLVHCEPEAEDMDQRIFYRDIEVPSFINLEKVHGLFLDDHKGIVSMVDTKGVLYALPMA